MNIGDASAVLAYASAGDNRTVTREAALIWAEALDPDMTVDEARRAIIAHFANSTDYLSPAHVNTIVRGWNIERTRILPAVTPPRDLADEPRREIEWKRIWGDAVIAGHTESAARNIANLQLGVSDDEPLAIGSAEITEAINTFTKAFVKPPPPIAKAIRRAPAMWAADRGLQILDPDGWREAGKDFREVCTEAEFDAMAATSTVGPFERMTEPLEMPPVGLADSPAAPDDTTEVGA